VDHLEQASISIAIHGGLHFKRADTSTVDILMTDIDCGIN
jgi:hypothetical protein